MALMGQRQAKIAQQRACELLTLGDTPCTLSGTPKKVSGYLEVRNPSDETLPLSTLLLEESDLRGSSGIPIRELYIGRTIASREATNVPIRLSLDRTTAPGEYRQTVLLGNTRQELIIQVAEFQQMDISPKQVVLEGSPRERITQTFLVSNQGNVPITLNQTEGVVLEEREMTCKALQTSLRNRGQEGFLAFLDGVVQELANARVDLLRTRIVDKPITILPGESSRNITLEFHLPGNLRNGRRYLGLLPIFNKSVNLKITATGTEN
jgi:hypothetical protein